MYKQTQLFLCMVASIILSTSPMLNEQKPLHVAVAANFKPAFEALRILTNGT